MDGQQVRLKENESNNQHKKFAFHRCYWSTDKSLGKAPVDNLFVFNDIGKEVLQHIYQGYNSTIFAYGQTGSGKSYSIEGYEEKGLLQMCLEDIFGRKEKIESEANGMAISVKVTYL